MPNVLEQIEKLKLIPMVKINDAKNAVPLAEALAEGGLPCVEITFRTDAAEDSIKAIAGMGNILLGAGTVLTEDHAKKAIDGGVQFVVTPGFAPKVVQYCIDNKVAVFPGTSTPTDLQMAVDFGLDVVKFFPAEIAGGLRALKAMSAPYHMMRFIPTGGIGSRNFREYLEFPKVVAVGGSWLAPAELITQGGFSQITAHARQASTLAAF